MKILHTADWHMNDTLGREDRSADICDALAQIAAYLELHQVDVMLVAGDLFSERGRPEQMRGAVSEIRRLFLPFLTRGGTIIAISGNHDSEIFFETLRDALDLVTPPPEARPGTAGASENAGANGESYSIAAPGRLYMSPNPRPLWLRDPAGHVVQFALMPYPTPRCYLRGVSVDYRTIEDKHRAVQDGFTRALQTMQQRFDPRLPSVLVSHIHVRGVNVRTLFRVSETEDVVFEPGDIPTHWAYVAYGHIHLAQPVLQGANHVRYSGSVQRLDAAEAHDQKSVVLLEVGPAGLMREPELLPLRSTPMLRIEIRDADDEIPRLTEQHPEHEEALVRYTLHYDPSRQDRDTLCRRINQIFPRWYDRELIESGGPDGVEPPLQPDRQNVPDTVRAYLEQRLAGHHDKAEILELAESLLARGGGA